MNLWLLFPGLGLGTFLLRFSFIYLFGRISIPETVRRALRFVPPAVLSGLVLPAVVQQNGRLALELGNERLFAAAAAGLVAWRSKNVFWTILVGMAVLWGLGALGI